MANKDIYKGMQIVEEDIDIETYILQNIKPKQLFLLVSSSCLPEKKRGNYRLMISYNSKTKLLTKELTNVNNANECILYGILDTVDSLVAPNFEIIVINCIGTGMHRYAKNKKVANVELIEQILDKLEDKKCFISELIFKSKANEIKNIINVNYPLSKNRKNNPNLKGLNIQEYTQEVIQNTRKEIFSKIAKNMIEYRYPKNVIATILEVSEKDVDSLINYKKQ